LSITTVSLFVVPSGAATTRVTVPDNLKIFVPGSATALQTPSDVSIGPLVGKMFNTNSVAVDKENENAKWKLTLPATDFAAFQRVDDVLLVLNYSLAAAH